jgi:hypothetical protein
MDCVCSDMFYAFSFAGFTALGRVHDSKGAAAPYKRRRLQPRQDGCSGQYHA